MSKEIVRYSSEQAIDLLKKGNERRLASIRSSSESLDSGQAFRDQRAKLVESEHPFAVLVSCSDSRFPPEIIFQNRDGDIFVVRTVGHVVGSDAAGSIEYAVVHLKVPLVVVMAHDKCGAVAAAASRSVEPGHILHVLEHIFPAVDAVKERTGDFVSMAITQHMQNTVERLRSMEPVLRKGYEEGTVSIIGARCSIETSHVEWFL